MVPQCSMVVIWLQNNISNGNDGGNDDNDNISNDDDYARSN